MHTLDTTIEETHLKTYPAVAGIDEAGRGPLAGPVVAATVVFDIPALKKTDWWHPIRDSKKITEKKREELFPIIIEHAQSYGIADASVQEIEQHNILGATFIAMQRAIEKAHISEDALILVDGNKSIPNIPQPQEHIVGGDAQVLSIAAASILAKVMRDKIMLKYHEKYPVYGFAQHKGYGTKQHRAMITEQGPCPIHRLSFLGNILTT